MSIYHVYKTHFASLLYYHKAFAITVEYRELNWLVF